MARRRPDRGNQWQIDFYVGGRRIRELHPAILTRRQAEALEETRRREVETEQIGAPHTWGALAARYWREHGQHLAWQDSVSGHLEALSEAIGDSTPIGKVAPDTFAAAIQRWRQQIAPATINRRLAIARNLWNMSSELWGVATPPIPWGKLQQPVPDRVPPYIAPAVRQAIMEKAAPHVRLAMRLALATGWRRASVLGLRWEHIDWQRGLLTGRGKGRAGGKILVNPLTEEIEMILLDPTGPPPPAGPIVRWHGEPVLDIKKGFDKARRDAGYPGVLFRDLRHSVAQEVLAATDSLEAAQAVLDHDRLATTRKHYARFQVAQKQRALLARAGRTIKLVS